ncbi:RNA-binding protein 27-like isoform X6 [Paramormyrops kingsleyae]|uniref:RNA-binding protein 27-like isoform X6 n=1 Tax=Paramormyrops kingsleyae TaxID=1676925 RepID=UPI003B978DD7
MIIDDVEALKSWMAKLLEPICDADPIALANYVVALVKKDKPEIDLKVLCANQLDVFLEKETTGFVEKLFRCLITKVYLEGLDKDTKGTSKVEGKFAVENFEDKKETAVAEDDGDDRSRRSPLRARLDLSESRAHSIRRLEGRRSRDVVRHGRSADSYRERRDQRAGSSHGRSRSRSQDRERTWNREYRCKQDAEKKAAESSRPALAPAALYCGALAQRSSERDSIPGSATLVPIHLPDSTTESCSHYCSGRGEGTPFIRSMALEHCCHDYDDKYNPDGYNPGVPSTTPAPQNCQFIPRIQTLRPNLIGLTSGDVDVHNTRGANIVIQTDPFVSAIPSNTVRYGGEHECRKRHPGANDGAPCTNPCANRQNYSYQRKANVQKRGDYGDTKLEVRKIPRDLNNITKLNGHFSKFGTVTSIQVKLGSDVEGALIQYATNAEARRAISSTEAVLNNRFIKVYWHHDNRKQLWQPGQPGQPEQPGQEARGPSKPLGQKPANISKVPTNTQVAPSSRLVIKGTAKSFGKTAKGLDAPEAVKKKQEVLKLQQDVMKRKQEMLEMQIQCQKALLNKLEKLKGVELEERAGIMKMLKELTEKISKLKEEMKPAPRVAFRAVESKSKMDTQKELLDAELDFHKKLASGEDTTDLQQKLNQLQVEVSRLGLIPKAHRRAAALWGRGGLNRMVVDHRPRALAVLGVTGEEKADLMAHFARFGEIVELQEQEPPGIVVTFRTRAEAEKAANQGSQFKDRLLQIAWYRPKAASVPGAEEEKESSQGEVKSSQEEKPHKSPLLAEEEGDEDEEDEYESRSWRR